MDGWLWVWVLGGWGRTSTTTAPLGREAQLKPLTRWSRLTPLLFPTAAIYPANSFPLLESAFKCSKKPNSVPMARLYAVSSGFLVSPHRSVTSVNFSAVGAEALAR